MAKPPSKEPEDPDFLSLLTEGALKALLKQGTESQVAENIAKNLSLLSQVPTSVSPEKKTIEFGLQQVRKAGKKLINIARRNELELELLLLDKPDEINLGEKVFEPISKRLEDVQIGIELDRRQGEALLAFCKLVEEKFS